MNRTFFYIPLLIVCFFQALYSQRTNYDSLLNTLPDVKSKHDFLVKELDKAEILGAALALDLAKRRLNYAMQLNDTAKVAAGYNSVGNQYLDLSDYSAALNYYLRSCKYYEMIADSFGLSAEYGNIGLVYSYKEDEHTAKKFMLKAMKILNKHKGIDRYYSTLGNLGDTYRSLNMIDSAFICYREVLAGSKDDSQIAIIYNNIGLYYYELEKIDSALKYFSISNKLDERRGTKLNYVISLGNLGDCYYKKGDDGRALSYYHKALSLSKDIKSPDQKMANCMSLARFYRDKKHFDSAYFYLDVYNTLADSIRDKNGDAQLADLKSGFDREAKEKELVIRQLEAEKQEQETKSLRNKFIVASVFLLSVIGFAVYRYKSKQRSYDELKTLNNEIVVQKNLVEQKQKEILDSITYAERIQFPLLAKEETLAQQFADFFVVFKPKDIVSGDFYWSTQLNEDFFLAVCDSTGHGVPGAFMSLLNIGFLSEAVKEKHIDEPESIFNYTRSRLIESLIDEGQKDGFDGIMIRYSKAKRLMNYCGAHNAPVLIRNAQIVDLSFDKMPVGRGERTEAFKGHEVALQKGDVIYLYTDGYADQFGGPKGKKFKYRQLNELLLNIYSKPMSVQKADIEYAFENWKGSLEQVDDVTIIGLRIG